LQIDQKIANSKSGGKKLEVILESDKVFLLQYLQ